MNDTVERETHIVSVCYFQPVGIFKIDVTTSDYVSYDAHVCDAFKHIENI